MTYRSYTGTPFHLIQSSENILSIKLILINNRAKLNIRTANKYYNLVHFNKLMEARHNPSQISLN